CLEFGGTNKTSRLRDFTTSNNNVRQLHIRRRRCAPSTCISRYSQILRGGRSSFIDVSQFNRDRRGCTESWRPAIAYLHLQRETRLGLKIEPTAVGHSDLPVRGIHHKDPLP